MVPKSGLVKAKSEIMDFFENLEMRIFSRFDFQGILQFHRDEWELPVSVNPAKFIEFLINECGFRIEECFFPSRKYTRYTLGEISVYEFLLSLVPKSYVSHHTALYFHDLTDRPPDRVYLNHLQERKSPRARHLEQGNIDTAFRRSVRVSKNLANFRGIEVLLLNSMGRGDLGLIEGRWPDGGTKIRVTDLERTLIDAAVRPVYAGGVSSVLAAYKAASGSVSIQKLAEDLKSLNYAYPYHQSIGFYLQTSDCYPDSEIDILRGFSMQYDFYLDYEMVETEYSKEWRLHFPKTLLKGQHK